MKNFQASRNRSRDAQESTSLPHSSVLARTHSRPSSPTELTACLYHPNDCFTGAGLCIAEGGTLSPSFFAACCEGWRPCDVAAGWHHVQPWRRDGITCRRPRMVEIEKLGVLETVRLGRISTSILMIIFRSHSISWCVACSAPLLDLRLFMNFLQFRVACCNFLRLLATSCIFRQLVTNY